MYWVSYFIQIFRQNNAGNIHSIITLLFKIKYIIILINPYYSFHPNSSCFIFILIPFAFSWCLLIHLDNPWCLLMPLDASWSNFFIPSDHFRTYLTYITILLKHGNPFCISSALPSRLTLLLTISSSRKLTWKLSFNWYQSQVF